MVCGIHTKGVGKMNMASYPNKRYTCSVCGKDLGSRRERLINPNNAKNVNKIKGKIYCDKHYEEALDLLKGR